MSGPAGTIHECPPPGGSFTPCCLALTSDLPRTDLLTTDPGRATCTLRRTAELNVDTDDGESPFGWREPLT
ncbi:hypothetical protein [Streptomyces sp. TE5632]